MRLLDLQQPFVDCVMVLYLCLQIVMLMVKLGRQAVWSKALVISYFSDRGFDQFLSYWYFRHFCYVRRYLSFSQFVQHCVHMSYLLRV